jgi:hypothetical protein
MSSILKKLVIVLAIVVFVLFIALMLAAWTMGMFSSVSVTSLDRGPYFIVSLHHNGPYRGINQKIEDVSMMLNEQRIEHKIACGVFHDDPAILPAEQLRSQGGYIVSDSIAVSPPFTCEQIDRRKVAMASIEANPAIAGFKTYPALSDWMRIYNYTTDSTRATLELYHPNGIVEVELPIILKETTQ